MNEIETTERYEYRTSNLMHSYYAANSVDGRSKIAFIASGNTLMFYIKKTIEKVSLFFNSLLNLRWSGIVPNININVMPKIKATPAYLIVNPNYINRSITYNGIHLPSKRYKVRNTTNK